MTNRKLFKRRVIELIHWLPYDEAIEIDWFVWCEAKHWYCTSFEPQWREWVVVRTYKEDRIYFVLDNWDEACAEDFFGWCYFEPKPVTIWRLTKALSKIYWQEFYDNVILSVDIWKLTNEYWSECTDDDQTDETIEKLYDLIK